MSREPLPAHPGSEEAIAQGCKCDPSTNCHGLGYKADEDEWWKDLQIFVSEPDCPLHGKGAREE